MHEWQHSFQPLPSKSDCQCTSNALAVAFGSSYANKVRAFKSYINIKKKQKTTICCVWYLLYLLFAAPAICCTCYLLLKLNEYPLQHDSIVNPKSPFFMATQSTICYKVLKSFVYVGWACYIFLFNLYKNSRIKQALLEHLNRWIKFDWHLWLRKGELTAEILWLWNIKKITSDIPGF